jgi:hypothetical protein
MFAIDHDKMENFLQEFDLEADPDHAGMIPGTDLKESLPFSHGLQLRILFRRNAKPASNYV